MSQMNDLLHHPFEPLIFPDARVLILGSFPSIASFEADFYYAHPRNQFWPLLGAVFSEPVSTQAEKIALCRNHRIALWDSARSLMRSASNSSDANLSRIVPNDIAALLETHPTIETLLFTGQKAQKIFHQHFKSLLITQILLPSPSPAYAAMRFEEKLSRYQEIFGALHL